MSRPKKNPNYNQDRVMQDFMAAVADAFGSYDDREDKTFPSLNAVAAEFGITALKAADHCRCVFNSIVTAGSEAVCQWCGNQPDHEAHRLKPCVRSLLSSIYKDPV